MAVRRQGRPDQGFTAARRLELADFALDESVSRQQRAIPAHSHDEPHLTIILEGRCREVYRGVTCLNGPLTVSYFHPGESHLLQVFDTPIRTFDIELNPKWLDRILPDPITSKYSQHVSTGSGSDRAQLSLVSSNGRWPARYRRRY